MEFNIIESATSASISQITIQPESTNYTLAIQKAMPGYSPSGSLLSITGRIPMTNNNAFAVTLGIVAFITTTQNQTNPSGQTILIPSHTIQVPTSAGNFAVDIAKQYKLDQNYSNAYVNVIIWAISALSSGNTLAVSQESSYLDVALISNFFNSPSI